MACPISQQGHVIVSRLPAPDFACVISFFASAKWLHMLVAYVQIAWMVRTCCLLYSASSFADLPLHSLLPSHSGMAFCSAHRHRQPRTQMHDACMVWSLLLA